MVVNEAASKRLDVEPRSLEFLLLYFNCLTCIMESGSIQYTDLRRWRLSSDCGDHHWRYLSEVESKCSPQNDAERYHLGLPLLVGIQSNGSSFTKSSLTFKQPATTPTPDARTNADPSNAKTSYDEAARKGWSFFTRLQLSEGHWACDYGGPSFLLPGLIFAMYISQTPIPGEWKVEIARYLANNVNDDGGWGLHIEGQSTAFATGLYYVMLRLTGMDVDAPITRNARACLLSLGGGVGIPQWGKIWLACLNLYKWEGVNCIPTDLWYVLGAAQQIWHRHLIRFHFTGSFRNGCLSIPGVGGCSAAWFTFRLPTYGPIAAAFL